MKKRKKYDPVEKFRKKSNFILKNQLITYILKSEQSLCYVIDAHLLVPIVIDPVIIKAISSVPYKWSFTLIVFCRSQTGQNYGAAQEVLCDAFQYHKDVQPTLNEIHNKLIGTCNPQHVCGCAWVASPHGKFLTDNELILMLDNQRAWEMPSNYELVQQDKVRSDVEFEQERQLMYVPPNT
jgi:hypothetical protein